MQPYVYHWKLWKMSSCLQHAVNPALLLHCHWRLGSHPSCSITIFSPYVDWREKQERECAQTQILWGSEHGERRVETSSRGLGETKSVRQVRIYHVPKTFYRKIKD